MNRRDGRTKLLASLCVALFGISALIVMAPPTRAEPYEYVYGGTTNLAVARGAFMCVMGDNDKAYAFGGTAATAYTTLASVVIYDTATGATTYGMTMPVGVGNAGVGKGLDGEMYVFGGYNSSIGTYVLNTQVYDPVSNTWTSTVNLPQAIHWVASASGANGKIYMFGGFYSGTAGNSTLIYDTVTASWNYGADIPTHRWGAAAVVLANNSIMVIGGSNGAALTTVEIYNPTADIWSTAGSLVSPVNGPRAELGRNGFVYLIGGVNSGYLFDGTPTSAIERYDPVAGTWTVSSYASLAVQRAFFGTGADSLGRIFALGGYTATGVITSDIDMLVVMDLEGPVRQLAITSPGDGAVVSGVVPVEAQIMNNWGSISYSAIDFLVDGALVESQTAGSSWVFMWDASALADGSHHTLMVRGYYQTGTFEASVDVIVASQSVEQKVASIESEIAALQTAISSLQSQTNLVNANVTDLQTRLTALQTQLNTLKTDQTTQGTQLTNLNSTLASLQQQLNDMQAQLDKVKTTSNSGSMWGMVNLVLIVVVIVLLALMLMMSRKKT